MTKDERLNFIIDRLRENNQVGYHELSGLLSVSADTIRRDISELAASGLISKTKGGARPKAIIPSTYQERELYANPDKRIIAMKAAKLFEDGQVAVFDGGTTPFLIASFLPRNISLTVFTHSYPIANLMFEFPNIELVFAGGRASKKSKISTGSDVLNKYSKLHANIGVLGVHSLHAEYGVTDPVMEEAEIKVRITEMCDHLIAVPSAEKLNTISTFQICNANAIDRLVTNLDPEDPLLLPYQEMGINIL